MTDGFVRGEAILYRLHDVGYAIDLEYASALLASSAPERRQPSRGEAQAIQIAHLPLTVHLGTESWTIGGTRHDVTLSARLFDFGVVSLRARLAWTRLPWSEFVTSGIAVSSERQWNRFDPVRDALLERLLPAVVRPGRTDVTEEYVVFRVGGIEGPSGATLPASVLEDTDIARLLLGEPRGLSAGARRDLLSERFSYFDDDLAVLTWNAALVVEPSADDTDVPYVLEFANAQLLELRYYDATLDRELPRINDEIAAARRGFHVMGRRYSRLLSRLLTRVADATESVERVENAFKVTDDVFLARVYGAALTLFREQAWRAGIDRKVTIVRRVYEMLNAESQARRTEVLEVVIILLIAVELVLALGRR